MTKKTKRKGDDMLGPDPIQADVRARRHGARFGSNPQCFLCGEKRPEALIHAPRSWIIEFHHLFGAANDNELVVPLCFNCHRKITARYADVGVPMSKPETFIHRLLAMLLGWEVFFKEAGTSCGEWGDQVRQLIEWFDDNQPGWREWTIWNGLRGS